MKKNNNKGFSLVELIVVIAIMAIMVGVLAPTLMRYVEKARVSKDISALGEVKNAMQLAAAEESVFNEIRDKGTAGQTIVVKMATKDEAKVANSGKQEGYYIFDATAPTEADNTGSKLEAEVAKTISKIQLTSTGLKSATITFTAKESKGAVTITVTGDANVKDEAVTPFAEAFPTN